MSAIDRLDHLVYATPDVARSVDDLELRLGVRAAPGGRHPAWGTHNALIALGERTYFEIVGPDPKVGAPAGQRPFGLDAWGPPRLVTWAAHAASLAELVGRARMAGVELGEPMARSRERADGTVLRWTMTDSTKPREGGVIPFFIDWGGAPHPATTSPRGGALIRLAARHPEPARVRALLRALDLDLEVEDGVRPELIATIATPAGAIELR